MEYIGIFKGDVHTGSRDGTEVSCDGLMTSPVEATLNEGQNTTVTCAVRCESGMISSSVKLSSISNWLTLSVDNSTFSDEITITNVGDTNKLFYAKFVAGSDVGVSTGAINLEATVEEV